MPEKLTDALTYALSVALAAGVMTFAAYKVTKLNGMEDPPANMGLNFPPAKPRVIMDEAAADADPIITRTLGAVQPLPEPDDVPEDAAPLSGPAARSLQLLAVVDGVAFVEIDLARGKTLLPVTVGTVLPGGMRIEAIERRDGRWILVAGPVRLEAADTPVQ
jgi:hypothetical protein